MKTKAGKAIFTKEPEDVAAAFDSAVEIEDFLPPPSQLVRRERKENITIAMKPSTVLFFKQQAKENGTQYQTMINELLDRYVEHFTSGK